jgi:peptidyl-prolyl cis-trans isomerase C
MVTVVLLSLLLLTLVVRSHWHHYHIVDRGPAVAKVNGLLLRKRDAEDVLKSFWAEGIVGRDKKLEELDRDVLEAVLLDTYFVNIIHRQARKRMLDRANDIKTALFYQRKRMLKEKFIETVVLGSIREEDIQKRYGELITLMENKEERRISHILLKTENEAEAIKNTVLRLNNFEKMAQKYSLDRTSAELGGDLGYFVKDGINLPEFAEIAFLLKNGELSKPIETRYGWHLIRIEDVRPVRIKTYKEARKEVLEQLQEEKLQEFSAKIMGKNPSIKIFPAFYGNNPPSAISPDLQPEKNLSSKESISDQLQ